MSQTVVDISTIATRLLVQRAKEVWGTCQLEDMGNWATGSGFPKIYQGYEGLPYLFCKVGDMNREGNEIYIKSTENTVDDVLIKKIKAKLHPSETIIFPKIGGAIATNKRRILTRETAVDNNVLGIIPSQSTNPKWLYYLLKSIDLSEYQSGTSVPSIKQSVIGKVSVPSLTLDLQTDISNFLTWLDNKTLNSSSWQDAPPLPQPLDEQRRIVARVEELAGKIEEARSLRQETLEETQRLVKSAFNETFNEGIENARWTLQPLTVAAEVARGKFAHRPRNEPRFYGGNIPFIQIGDISNANRYIRKYSQTLNEEGLKISRIFPKDTVVIAITGATIGVTGILTFDSCFPDSIVGIIPRQNIVIPEFIYWSLEYVKNVALAEATQTTQPNINLKNLNKLEIPTLTVPEQKEIVAYLDNLQNKVDEMKRLREDALKELDAMLPSILDKAFKGEL